MNRAEIAATLKDATVSYWSHKRFSCFTEIAVNRWGKLRADVLAVNLRGHVVLCEIKSSRADYVSDNKWHKYKDYADTMYFVMPKSVYLKLETRLKKDLKHTGIGVFILDPDTGYLKNVISARKYPINDDIRWELVIRMAWRSGESRRTRRQRRRHYGIE